MHIKQAADAPVPRNCRGCTWPPSSRGIACRAPAFPALLAVSGAEVPAMEASASRSQVEKHVIGVRADGGMGGRHQGVRGVRGQAPPSTRVAHKGGVGVVQRQRGQAHLQPGGRGHERWCGELQQFALIWFEAEVSKDAGEVLVPGTCTSSSKT